MNELQLCVLPRVLLLWLHQLPHQWLTRLPFPHFLLLPVLLYCQLKVCLFQ